MTPLTETAAERHLRDTALTPAAPGFVGVAADCCWPRRAYRSSLVESLASGHSCGTVIHHRPIGAGASWSAARRRPAWTSAPSGWPRTSRCRAPLIGGHGIAVLDEAADTVSPASPPARLGTATAGIRVALEAGIDGAGPYGMRHRWAVAQAIAPVLAAAFANSPLQRRPPDRVAQQPAVRSGSTSHRPWVTTPRRSARAAQVRDAPVSPRPHLPRPDPLRPAGPPDLRAHLRDFRPPVAARGHLEIDVADRQPGNGWRVPLAVITALIEDPLAARPRRWPRRPPWRPRALDARRPRRPHRPGAGRRGPLLLRLAHTRRGPAGRRARAAGRGRRFHRAVRDARPLPRRRHPRPRRRPPLNRPRGPRARTGDPAGSVS